MGANLSARGGTEAVIATAVGKYLGPTQARAALCATRVDAAALAAVYDVLSTNLEKEATEKAPVSRSQRMGKSKKKAVERACSKRDTFWAMQQHVCELCMTSKSCSRKRCKGCVNNSDLKFVSKEMDICCYCNRLWSARDTEEDRRKAIVTAAMWWQMAAPLSKVTLPSEFVLGYDHGGLVVRRQDFKVQEIAFWERVQEARADRTQKQAILQRIREQLNLGEQDIEFAYSLLADQSKADDRILRWTGLMLQSHLDNWRRVPVGEESKFFKYEELIVNFIGQGIQLLRVTERFEMQIANVVNRTMLCQSDRRATEAGISVGEIETWTSLQCLDCISVLLLGKPMSHVTRQNAKLVRALGRELVKEKAFPAMYSFQDQVQMVRARISAAGEQDKNKKWLAAFVELEVQAPALQAQSVLELWCSDPGAVAAIAASAPGRESRRNWDEVIAELDAVHPRRETLMEDFVQRLQEPHKEEAPPRHRKKRRTTADVDDGKWEEWSKAHLTRHLIAMGESVDGIKPTLVARLHLLKRRREEALDDVVSAVLRRRKKEKEPWDAAVEKEREAVAVEDLQDYMDGFHYYDTRPEEHDEALTLAVI